MKIDSLFQNIVEVKLIAFQSASYLEFPEMGPWTLIGGIVLIARGTMDKRPIRLR